MSNKDRVLRAIKRKGESSDFYAYCENMLTYFDYIGLPALRDFYKYNATPHEVKLTTGMSYTKTNHKPEAQGE